MKKRILIPYASYGSGHRAIAQYIKQYFLKMDPELEIKTVDLMDYSMPVVGKISQSINEKMMLKAPFLHALNYYAFDTKVTGTIAEKASLFMIKNKRLLNDIREFNPDLTISTHFFGNFMMNYTNKKGISHSKLITVITDYEAQQLWVNDYKTDNYYVVGAKEEVPRMIKRGIPKNSIKVFGIPIMPKNTEKMNREKLLKKYHLTGMHPICVFFGGGGNGSMASLPFAKRVFSKKYPIDYIYIAGRNLKNKEKVDAYLEEKHITNVHTYGFVDTVPEMLYLSDFVVSKPGGGQTTECLYFNKPVLMINSSGGQETANYKLFTHNGYGKWFRTSWGLSNYIGEIAKNPRILEPMVTKMKKIDNTQSMDKLYSLAVEVLEKE